jgi:hypothetical protein
MYTHPVANSGSADGTDTFAINNPDAIPLGNLNDDSDDDDAIQFQTSVQVTETMITESNPEAISLAMSDDDDSENEAETELTAKTLSSSSMNTNETTQVIIEKFAITTFLALSKRESRFEFLDVSKLSNHQICINIKPIDY